MTKIMHSTIVYCPITGAKHIEKEVCFSEKHFEKQTKEIKCLAQKPNKNRTTNK
jgi:hypothetical protein